MANQQVINAFGAALGRIGINLATRAAISNNGFTTILNLVMVQEEDLDRLPKHLEAWRNPAVAVNQQVRIPFVSLKLCVTGLSLNAVWALMLLTLKTSLKTF
jgi:hypothetical protein